MMEPRRRASVGREGEREGDREGGKVGGNLGPATQRGTGCDSCVSKSTGLRGLIVASVYCKRSREN